MANARKILPNYTYADYCQWEGKWEIIDGIPHAMSPSPSVRHQKIASRMNVILSNELLARGCSQCEVLQPIDIKMTEHTVVQPDLSILCQPVSKSYLDFPPTLVVEILSPSTREKDLITKFELYCSFGVKYYVIADPEDKSITAYLQEDSTYHKMETPFKFLLEDSCKITPDFSEVFR
jgi:Uma2 family endonuclease